MNDEILQAIDAELSRLQQARAILAAGLSSSGQTGTPRRRLSAKSRKAIADAQRKRWAKVKGEKKAAAPATS